MKIGVGDSKEKSIVAMALSIGGDGSLYDGCEGFDPVARAMSGARVTGLAVAAGQLRIGSDDANLEFTLLRSFCLARRAPTPSIVPLESESEILAQVSDLFARLSVDWLFTWSGDDVELPFLRLKGFFSANQLAWLPAGAPAIASAAGVAHIDLRRLLLPGGSKVTLSEVLEELRFTVPEKVRGIDRLDLFAMGIFALAARAIWQSGLLDDGAYVRSFDDFSRVLKGQALLQPHFAVQKQWPGREAPPSESHADAKG